jgi:ADP-dependent NAD(P)H-hydrate dehydratase / NAD(P)H-hydrate epimerase
VIPVLLPDEARELDASSTDPIEVLIDRAGWAVARQALDLLGGSYGKRVVVLAGKGNNGADGREAARLLRRRGVATAVVDVHDAPRSLPPCDLVVDAAFGTGFRGEWDAPATSAPVLAVDIPSGVDAVTGEVRGRVLPAIRTVTFAGMKPGLLFGAGADRCGAIVIADIGLDAGSVASAFVVERVDVASWLPERPHDSHKWKAPTWVVAGSTGMTGAAVLAARGAQRVGSGYVRLSMPGVDSRVADVRVVDVPPELVQVPLPGSGWAGLVADGIAPFKALVVGPGLGRGGDADVRSVVHAAPVPVVVDGDGLTALAPISGALPATTVLTPHDGEFRRLAGDAPGADRLGAARSLAAACGCTVLLKGSTTVVAEPNGRVLLVTEGDARLATAGTGDVLAGVIGGLLAQGMAPAEAAAAGAWLHGAAGKQGPRRGITAGDLPDFVVTALASLES